MKVKICGITNIKDALLASSAGADALGFIFFKGSKRYITSEKAFNIINKLPPFISKVGVFVNETPEEVSRIAAKCKLDYVQLHGDENPAEYISDRYSIIKAYRIKSDKDFSDLSLDNNVTYLLDSYSSKEYGGSGLSFDWNSIPQDLSSWIILAGGVSVENIAHIYENIKPAAVDLSSSVESEPGIKDPAKLKQFFRIFNKLRYK